jgi:hypothetical protein
MDIEELFPNTQLAITPPETETEPGEEEEPSPYVGKYDRAYETVVPTCFYDLKRVDYIVRSTTDTPRDIIESGFETVGVTYDIREEWDKTSHVESFPIIEFQDSLIDEIIPEPSELTDLHSSYGFHYSSQLNNHSKAVWYTHTDLDYDVFEQIDKDIRQPIIEKVKRAKSIETALKYCKYVEYITKKIQEQEPAEGEEPREVPNFPPPIIIDQDGEEVITTCQDSENISCDVLVSEINNIPLECELIKEVLGEEYSGVNFDKYWWEDWIDDLSVRSLQDVDPGVPFHGTTFNGPNFFSSETSPPYQEIIGSYVCPVSDLNQGEEDDMVEAPQNNQPWFGNFGGFTADPCGCISVQEVEDNLPDYINKCSLVPGEKYPEYLEYVKSKNCRYWNTPRELPLLRNAQMKHILSQSLAIKTGGDFSIRVGDIIRLKNTPAPQKDGNVDDAVNDGNWLVASIKHAIDVLGNQHDMILNLVRDSNYK